MQALNRQRMVAIQFFSLDVCVGEYVPLPFSTVLLSPLLLRLDRQVFFLSNLYSIWELIRYYVKPQSFWAFVNVYQQLGPRFIPDIWSQFSSQMPWSTTWIFPALAIFILLPTMLFFEYWLFAWVLDRFYLRTRLRRVFAIWGDVR